MAVKVVQPRFKTVFLGDEARIELAVLFWRETVPALKDASAVNAANLARAGDERPERWRRVQRRPHSTFGGRTPDEVYAMAEMTEQLAA